MLIHDYVMAWKYHRTTAPLWEKSDGHWWILFKKSSIMELWVFLLCQTAYAVEQTVQLAVASVVLTLTLCPWKTMAWHQRSGKPYRSQNMLAYALHYQQRQKSINTKHYVRSQNYHIDHVLYSATLVAVSPYKACRFPLPFLWGALLGLAIPF